jgi:hypothetical protein
MKPLTILLSSVIFIFVMSLLTGCSANLNWFLRNLTNKEVILTLRYETYMEKNGSSFLPLKSKHVKFKNQILKIEYETINKLNDSLKINEVNYSTYEIVIPPQSTIDITHIIPTGYGQRCNVIAEFKQDGKIYSVNTTSIFNKHKQFKMTGGLLLKNLVYYDYGTKNNQ